jgi:hypothetical protein
VFHRVRERLLHHPVGRQVDGGRHLAPGSVDPHVDGHPGLAHPVHHRLQRHQAGQRRLGVVVPAEQSDDRPGLRQRVPAGVGDDLQGLLGGGRIAVQQVGAHAGLHGDQRHAVRDDVVQFPGDAQPLLGDRPLGRDLGPAFGRGEQVALVGPALADRVADRDRRHADGHARRDVDDGQVGNARALQGDERHDDQDQAEDRLAAGAVGRHRVQGQHRQIRQHPGEVPGAGHDGGGARDRGQAQQRHPAPEPDPGGAHGGGQDGERRCRVQAGVDRVQFGADQYRDRHEHREHRQDRVHPGGRAPDPQRQHTDLCPGHAANGTEAGTGRPLSADRDGAAPPGPPAEAAAVAAERR